MKYTNKTFSAPVAGSKVSQKQWDAIFSPKPIEVKIVLYRDYLSWDPYGLEKQAKLNKVQASRKKSKS